MTAREKFQIGQRVQMTAKAREMVPLRVRQGRVTKLYFIGPYLQIKRGTKREDWHMDFWEPISGEEASDMTERTEICKCGDPFIGVQYAGTSQDWDGVSEWLCPTCGQRHGRWSKRVLADDELEARDRSGPVNRDSNVAAAQARSNAHDACGCDDCRSRAIS